MSAIASAILFYFAVRMINYKQLDFLGSFSSEPKTWRQPFLGIYKGILTAMNEDVTAEGRQGIYCSLPRPGSK